jgi:hypothetical protein
MKRKGIRNEEMKIKATMLFHGIHTAVYEGEWIENFIENFFKSSSFSSYQKLSYWMELRSAWLKGKVY